jgi:nucleoside-diphosphate-sugar epimerase
MRIFVAGASGVLGQAAIPHLGGHDVVGLTRSADNVGLIESLGAQAVVGDAYDRDAMVRVVAEARPHAVVNFLTDLAGRDLEANARLRREAGPILVEAARAAGARRFVVESVAFPLEGGAAEALASLEEGALSSGLQALVLRFGLLWGPGTWYEQRPEPPNVHVAEAGRRAAELITSGQPGVHVVVADVT